jgi:transposase
VKRPRGQTTSFQERLEIGERTAAGQSKSDIAQALGCSIYTVRKWRRRYLKDGRDGLSSEMGRPAGGPLTTVNPALKAHIRQMRQSHPGWGPDTILTELEQDPYWKSQPLASRSRIAAFLKAEELTRPYQRHVELPQPTPQEATHPHQEWEMDAQGAIAVTGLGSVSLINVIDVASRLKVESCPRLNRPKPARADYLVTLRRAFINYGLPQRLSLDHDTVFFDNTSPSPFPTRLHLWLIGLDIDLIFTRKGRPTDHAQVERNHQTIEAQAITGQSWFSQSALWQGLDQRRAVLNHYLPIRALNGQAPLEAFPQAAHSGRPYRPQWEQDLLSLDRVYHYLAQGRWFRRIRANGHFGLGGHTYYVGHKWAKRAAEITFDPDQLAFSYQPEGCDEQLKVLARGLTKADLMGDLADLLQLPSYQLAFPFTVEDQRLLDLVNCLTDTTS